MLWFTKPKPLPPDLEALPEPTLEPLTITPLQQVTGKMRLPSGLIAELRTAFKRDCEYQALRASNLEELHRVQGARDAFEKFLNMVGEMKGG